MEKSGFFNSSGGDRVYSATDFAAYFGKLVSNGAYRLVSWERRWWMVGRDASDGTWRPTGST